MLLLLSAPALASSRCSPSKQMLLVSYVCVCAPARARSPSEKWVEMIKLRQNKIIKKTASLSAAVFAITCGAKTRSRRSANVASPAAHALLCSALRLALRHRPGKQTARSNDLTAPGIQRAFSGQSDMSREQTPFRSQYHSKASRDKWIAFKCPRKSIKTRRTRAPLIARR
jgi:hypothetical protein